MIDQPATGRVPRTADPLELSSRIIDTGVADEPTNRIVNTSGWNVIINRRQSGGVSLRRPLAAPQTERFIGDTVSPDMTYTERLTVRVGDLDVELAAAAAPDDKEVHGARAEIYRARRAAESSLMSKGIFAAAARESAAIAEE